MFLVGGGQGGPDDDYTYTVCRAGERRLVQGKEGVAEMRLSKNDKACPGWGGSVD